MQLRHYDHEKDFLNVCEFLAENYKIQKGIPFNWCRARWEYMFFHPFMYKRNLFEILGKIGVWEEEGKIIAVVHFEDDLGQAYIETLGKNSTLKKEILDYAKENLSKTLTSGRKTIKVFVNQYDTEMEKLVVADGFTKDSMQSEVNTTLKLEPDKLNYIVPEGFRIQSLEDDDDVEKITLLLHKGFNHDGEPAEGDSKYTKIMQDAPHYDKNLQIVAMEEKSASYVSLCGAWYDEIGKFVYIEPVATLPDFRFMGLGKAVVYEAIKRAHDKGATIALVGSGRDFYRALGFSAFFTNNCWVKYF